MPSRETPCDALHHHHRIKLALCERLEAIADSLPDGLDRHACMAIAAELLPAMRQAQDYEEHRLFPVVSAAGIGETLLQRLHTQHVEDEASAEELTEALLGLGHGSPVANAEALGFMLRAFFEALRRHIAFEDNALGVRRQDG